MLLSAPIASIPGLVAKKVIGPLDLIYLGPASLSKDEHARLLEIEPSIDDALRQSSPDAALRFSHVWRLFDSIDDGPVFDVEQARMAFIAACAEQEPVGVIGSFEEVGEAFAEDLRRWYGDDDSLLLSFR